LEGSLHGEREEPYFKDLTKIIEKERLAGKTIYPKNSDVFNALQFCPFESVKSSYHRARSLSWAKSAHGLCFSVLPGVPAPPSLVNIFKEISSDLNIPKPNHGCLEKWARQGVLLLNAVLTVEAGRPQSHGEQGWERFTDRVIYELNRRKSNLVFLLWGSHAQKKCEGIDPIKHCILKAPHPSPLSAVADSLDVNIFPKLTSF